MKHTQGKWEVKESHNSRTSRTKNIIYVKGVDYKNNPCDYIIASGTANKANANLIAAAPDMLEALQEICGEAWALDEIQPDQLTYNRLYKMLKGVGVLAERATDKAEAK